MLSYRTDLAMEAFDGQGKGTLPGVEVNRWEAGGVFLTEVLITDAEAERLLGKPVGRYLTLECGLLRRRLPEARAAMESLLAEELGRMLPERKPDACALVVGLGNRGITPDALGPAVVDRTLVTRHLSDQLRLVPGLRPVSAIAPGVMGVTGMETMDVVERLAGLVRPAAVICVDSLAARDAARVGATLQLTDTGIPRDNSATRFSGTLISTSISPDCTKVITVWPAATTCPSSAEIADTTPLAPAVRLV